MTENNQETYSAGPEHETNYGSVPVEAAAPAEPEGFDPSYVVENVDYYRAQYQTFKTYGKTDFNWAAFFFAGFWCFYRKLYVLGFLLLVSNVVPGFGLLTNFFSGFLGNKLYFQEMERNLAVGDRSTAGVNKWVIYAGIIAAVLLFLLFCCTAALFVSLASEFASYAPYFTY